MFIQDIKYTLGKRTLVYMYFKYAKKYIFLFLLMIYFSIIISFFNYDDLIVNYLYSIDFYMTNFMIILWTWTLTFCLFLLLNVSIFEHYLQFKFTLSEHSFHIRRGLFFYREKVIPYRHIQNVDIEQPYHFRLLGIAKLNITTARIDNFENDINNLIPVIDKKIAIKLSKHLINMGHKEKTNVEII